jgi:CRP/FNR family cyclic AMP-dependent transcriptional regulator
MHLATLAAASPFLGLAPERLRDLAAHSVEQSLAEGRLVFAHGDTGDAVYLVLEGTVTLYRDQVGKPMQLLARVGAGELFGELCLFDDEPRTATARTASPCRLLRLAREPFRQLLALEPRVALHVQNTAARRRSSNSAAALQLGQQADLRIRLDAPVRLRFADGTTTSAGLENLSVGGLSLSGTPKEWGRDVVVEFDLVAGDDEPLPVNGRVAWREGDVVGIAFVSQAPGHERHVYRLLRRLAEG